MTEEVVESLKPSWQRVRFDRVWLFFFASLALLAIAAPANWWEIVTSIFGNLAHTGIFIAFAVFLIAWLRATGAQALIGRAFQGRESHMIVMAAMFGGLAPFCSCEVIPFVAALLAMGTPLSAVMAFWLSSPIMDPPMFVITSSALGFDFAVAKTVAAVSFGLLGGSAVMLLGRFGFLSDPLRDSPIGQCGACGSADPFNGDVQWRFWQHSDRLSLFTEALLENALFLLKWMALAYLLEALMIRYVPAEWISQSLGGDGIRPVLLGTLFGGPAYMNGYAAVPLVQGMIEQGMSQGAAMSFVLAGSVSCIPAAIAVWALVKPHVFATYLALGLVASFLGGIVWNLVS